MNTTKVKKWARRIRWPMLGALVTYVVFLTGMFVVMCQPPLRFGQIMAYVPMPAMMLLPFETMWNAARGGTTRVGDMAPDFVLPTVDRKSQPR